MLQIMNLKAPAPSPVPHTVGNNNLSLSLFLLLQHIRLFYTTLNILYFFFCAELVCFVSVPFVGVFLCSKKKFILKQFMSFDLHRFYVLYVRLALYSTIKNIVL